MVQPNRKRDIVSYKENLINEANLDVMMWSVPVVFVKLKSSVSCVRGVGFLNMEVRSGSRCTISF